MTAWIGSCAVVRDQWESGMISGSLSFDRGFADHPGARDERVLKAEGDPMDFRPCADQSIDTFAQTLGDGYYPKWYDLVPTDTVSGWGASAPDWRQDAQGIITDFEKCAGAHVGFNWGEIDTLGGMTLSDFAEYLVEKAEESAAVLVVKIAKAQLAAIRDQHKLGGFQAKLAKLS
jgi:hypothetical protein